MCVCAFEWPCWIKKCTVIKDCQRRWFTEGSDDKSEELTHWTDKHTHCALRPPSWAVTSSPLLPFPPPPSLLSHSHKTCLTPLMCVCVCACLCVRVSVHSSAAQRICCWASLLGLPHIFFKGAVLPKNATGGAWGWNWGSRGGAAVWVGEWRKGGGGTLQCYSSPRSQRE